MVVTFGDAVVYPSIFGSNLNSLNEGELNSIAITIANGIMQELHMMGPLIYQFVLEELDAARQGNQESKKFAEESGYDSEEYIGAMARSDPRIDGPGGPQQNLNVLSLSVPDIDTKTKFRILVVKHLMNALKNGGW